MAESLEQLLQFINQVEDKVAQGEVGKALSLARAEIGLPDPEQVLLQLLSRWNAAERDVLANLISEDDYKVERAQVTKSLLLFLRETKTALEREGEESEDLSVGNDVLDPPDFDGKPQVLVLYAPEDEPIWTELSKHLFVMMREEAIQFVDAQQVVPATVKDPLTYQGKLVAQARIVLALVSPNALTPTVFELAEQALSESKLIPIRIEEVHVQGTPFREDIKGLPQDGRFVSAWPSRNSAWVDVAQALQKLVNRIKEEAN